MKLGAVNLTTDNVGATQVCVGHLHTCVLFENNGVKCFGSNFYGALGYGSGNGTRGEHEVPAAYGYVNVSADPSDAVLQIECGSHWTCAVFASGGATCWGAVYVGRLGGRTDNIGLHDVPANYAYMNISDGDAVQTISTGHDAACARLASGAIRCWGSGKANGVTGSGSYGGQLWQTPAALGNVPLGTNASVVDLAFGFMHACVLLDNNEISKSKMARQRCFILFFVLN